MDAHAAVRLSFLGWSPAAGVAPGDGPMLQVEDARSWRGSAARADAAFWATAAEAVIAEALGGAAPEAAAAAERARRALHAGTEAALAAAPPATAAVLRRLRVERAREGGLAAAEARAARGGRLRASAEASLARLSALSAEVDRRVADSPQLASFR